MSYTYVWKDQKPIVVDDTLVKVLNLDSKFSQEVISWLQSPNR